MIGIFKLHDTTEWILCPNDCPRKRSICSKYTQTGFIAFERIHGTDCGCLKGATVSGPFISKAEEIADIRCDCSASVIFMENI